MKRIAYFMPFFLSLLISSVCFGETVNIEKEKYDEMKALLELSLIQIEQDRETISELRIYRDELENRIFYLERKVEKAENRADNSQGLYLGGGVGYPFPMGMGIIEYRFTRWGIMGFGGYGGDAFIGLGGTIKVGKTK